MNATLEQLGIDRMSVPDRIELIGLIWDSLGETVTSGVPEWHLRELEKRHAAAEKNPQASIPWEVVKERLTRPT